MSTLGNREDLFPSSSYVSKYITNPPDDYEVPAAYLDDATFNTLITEAEKYLGYPYVWGGSNPDTSFDCSGFVSWVLTNSGLVNTGRLGAQGLYNVCTPVSSADAQPGDLIFFVGTYDTPGVSHVGIYVGDGVMEERDRLDPSTQKPISDQDGNALKETVEVTRPAFKVVSVFDVSQTDGKEIPDISVDELTGSVENYTAFFDALKQESPVPIAFEDILGGAKGYYHLEDRRIAIQENMILTGMSRQVSLLTPKESSFWMKSTTGLMMRRWNSSGSISSLSAILPTRRLRPMK